MQSTDPERIPVAVGLIFDPEGRVLIGKRNATDRYLGKWEFPGGKIEEYETESEALRRELFEELGISVIDCEPFMRFPFNYPDRNVMLNFRVVKAYEGEEQSREQQQIRWVEIDNLVDFDMLDPNVRVIEELQKISKSTLP